ncbi:MAG: hypothetical protein KUG73_09245, partial [Pseudomonadales bacterium]|nr:hypothetical protein [Pseudomonadales bacterium]
VYKRQENPQDDSVVHFILGKQTVLRRGRGYGLVPEAGVENSVSGHSQDVVTLSVGGHVKNTIALGMSDQVVLSPHIGDLDTLASTRRYQQTIERFCGQQGVIPNVYIRDFHPQYSSSEVAERNSALLDSHDTEKVGHHFSHALACRFEHGIKGLALMVVWDGLGMGVREKRAGREGGASGLWGSEFFVDDGSGQGFPVAALLPFPLPGGDLAAKQPKRMGLSLLIMCGLPTEGFLQHQFPEFTEAQQQLLATTVKKSIVEKSVVEKSIQSPMARSIGRLLDGISSLLHLCQKNTFEGEAAMALQYAAERGALVVNNSSLDAPYEFSVIEKRQGLAHQQDANYQIDWRPMVQQVIVDQKAETSVDVIAFRVHRTLIDMISWVFHALNNKRLMAEEGGIESIIVSGGCFQNRLLIEILSAACERLAIPLHWPQKYPTNDGGLALGQWVAFQRGIKRHR